MTQMTQQLATTEKLTIITADERLREKTGVKMVIFGPTGIGKTSLLKTLDQSTLCIDMEAGLLAVQDWQGDSLKIRTWDEARDIACLIGGANPALRDDQPYSKAHYGKVYAAYEEQKLFSGYSCIFIDSITVASRLCLNWCKGRPEAFSDKTCKPDPRGAYGLLAQEMMAWLNQFQHITGKDVILVGILEKKLDDFNRPYWAPQIEGSKTANELPGVLDEVISLVEGKAEDGNTQKPINPRVFVCQTLNPWGYPAKDRSGRLALIEEPHLGALLTKIKSPLKKSSSLNSIELNPSLHSATERATEGLQTINPTPLSPTPHGEAPHEDARP